MNDRAGKVKTRVLFVCIHNAARSQMAEAFLNHLAGERFEAESAGLEPSELNPLAVAVMKEAGVDISANRAKKVFDLYREDRLYDYVIPVCDEAAERCPTFPSFAPVLHWSFEDPDKFVGNQEERLARMRSLRDQIGKKVEEFIAERQVARS